MGFFDPERWGFHLEPCGGLNRDLCFHGILILRKFYLQDGGFIRSEGFVAEPEIKLHENQDERNHHHKHGFG